MHETDLLPAEPAPDVAGPCETDPRGWPMALVAMALIGVAALRPAPAPEVPERVVGSRCESWMVDALPGIGPRTRERHRQHVRDGAPDALPVRARTIARQVFILPEPTTRSAALPAP